MLDPLRPVHQLSRAQRRPVVRGGGGGGGREASHINTIL